MKKIFFVSALCASVMTLFAQDGALKGKFTVNFNGDQVVFSKGNLQFNALVGEHLVDVAKPEPGTFRFAEHQFDYVGDNYFGNVNYKISEADPEAKCNNQLIAQEDYYGWIDLFAWGTGFVPNDTVAQRPDNAGHYAIFNDWGRNQISNGGEYTDRDHAVWRTLSKAEWHYIFRGRTNAEKLFAYGKVGDVNGLVILPDDWSQPEGVDFEPSVDVIFIKDLGNGYKVTKEGPHATDPYHNEYSAEDWDKMEQNGAVFLPAGGNRYYHNETEGVSTGGYYWSSDELNEEHDGYAVSFGKDVFYSENGDAKMTGLSVRLVQDIEHETAVDQMENGKSANGKFVKDGQLYIIRDGKTYTATGVEVR